MIDYCLAALLTRSYARSARWRCLWGACYALPLPWVESCVRGRPQEPWTVMLDFRGIETSRTLKPFCSVHFVALLESVHQNLLTLFSLILMKFGMLMLSCSNKQLSQCSTNTFTKVVSSFIFDNGKIDAQFWDFFFQTKTMLCYICLFYWILLFIGSNVSYILVLSYATVTTWGIVFKDAWCAKH